ncbi:MULTISPECIES: hypothetical protein [unclassified Spirosoma]|uniref:hypothetical protein n=1 Tax=unclassified Spirosoma TaxID=2621999 RepID=UPI0009660B11|nr:MULTISPECIES: hypothetical protein [unclassified Spirosoma]MBN8824429.1 hypothetical protein [Spirosoma sp.]OJW70108.1 MAG: hypothetical protein BGO59_25885 [Spirosoma sp. 48-14]
MLPIDFPGRNRILHGPRDEQGNPTSDILDLPSFTNDVVCISCWQLTDEEKQQLRQSLGIYVFLFYSQIDPIHISAICPIRNYSVVVEPVALNILYKDDEKCITYWELSDDEIDYIQHTGTIWFTIQSGDTQPPVGFMTENPFVPQPII